MKVLKWAEITEEDFDLLRIFPFEDRAQKGSSLTIGGFDGPHVGHDSIFQKVLARKDLMNGVITFERSPRALKSRDDFSGDVSTLAQRLQRFEVYGFDFVVLIDFSQDFGKIKGRIFLDILYSACRVRFLVVGNDFRCGYRLDTGTQQIAAYAAEKNIMLEVVPDYFIGLQRVSSSLIRQAIQQADFIAAEQFLGYPYSIDCTGFMQTVTQLPENETYIDLKPESGFSQIIPPVGQYTVCIKTKAFESCQEQKISSFTGTLNVTPDFLRCRLPFNSSPLKVQTIQFVLF